MTIHNVLLLALVLGASPAALAQDMQTTPSQNLGTPEQQAACRPDTRKLCRAVAPDAGVWAFLACLKENREKLSAACRQVLESNGQ